jgi:hypothetical protein
MTSTVVLIAPSSSDVVFKFNHTTRMYDYKQPNVMNEAEIRTEDLETAPLSLSADST